MKIFSQEENAEKRVGEEGFAKGLGYVIDGLNAWVDLV
jgi:hypothetical protein